MTKYIVHLYREMRLCYTDIEADTPEAAAEIAGSKPTDDADNIDDCEGQNLAALIDVAGDEDYSQSVTIDFEPERQRRIAPRLLEALKVSEGFVHWALKHGADRDGTAAALEFIRHTIDAAKEAGIPSVSTTAPPKLLAALQRAEFLMRRVSDGDHRALENLLSAADQALDAIADAAGETPHTTNRTLTIEVRGGVVQDVSNVPPGWDYEIIDHDNAEQITNHQPEKGLAL
jgi:hypothetical protein